MKKQDGYNQIPEDTKCSGDCLECPFFLRFDICGYEVSTTLIKEECV